VLKRAHMQLDERLVVARAVAREAGALLRSSLGTHLTVHSKDVRANLVTQVDTQSEALIRRRIGDAFPGDAVLGEESGQSAGDAEHRWIVDPLDGTTNYTHGYRCFCVSIAFERYRSVEFGLVYDPMADELFEARHGGGATCNGQALQVSQRDDLRDALLCTGFPPYKGRTLANSLGIFGEFMQRAQAIRRDGSAALDLCYVAAGRFDGFWECGLHAWDIAAGMLVVQEAGGATSDYRGSAARLDAGQIVASNGKIHDAMIDLLCKHA
jgi:myo-inositol-1(or 4)-monophosphatase